MTTSNQQIGSFPGMAKPPASSLPPPLSKPNSNMTPTQLKANIPHTVPGNQIPFGTPTNLRQPTSVSNNPPVNGHHTTQNNLPGPQMNGQQMQQTPMMPNGQVSHQQSGWYLFILE